MVECINGVGNNTFSNIFNNIKCINTVTVWFLIAVMSIFMTALSGALYAKNSYNKSLRAVLYYFSLLIVVSIAMMIICRVIQTEGVSSVLSITVLIILLIVLSFVGQYVALKKGTCPPEKKPNTTYKPNVPGVVI